MARTEAALFHGVCTGRRGGAAPDPSEIITVSVTWDLFSPLVRERLALERLEQDIDAFLEQFAVGLLVEQRRAEHLARPSGPQSFAIVRNAWIGRWIG